MKDFLEQALINSRAFEATGIFTDILVCLLVVGVVSTIILVKKGAL